MTAIFFSVNVNFNLGSHIATSTQDWRGYGFFINYNLIETATQNRFILKYGVMVKLLAPISIELAFTKISNFIQRWDHNHK